jgi:transposase-like protein
MALVTVDKENSGDFRSKDRWSANKKLDVVLRLLRGEKLEEVSREVGVEAHRLAAWRDEFLDAGKEGLPVEGNFLAAVDSHAQPPWALDIAVA